MTWLVKKNRLISVWSFRRHAKRGTQKNYPGDILIISFNIAASKRK